MNLRLSVRVTLASNLIWPIVPAANAQLLRTVALSDVRPSELPAVFRFEASEFRC